MRLKNSSKIDRTLHSVRTPAWYQKAQELQDFCGEQNINPDVEIIDMAYIP